MDRQNLSYALIHVVHNFGAVSVVGGAAFARWQSAERQERLARWVLLGWIAQAVSGAGFGAVSYIYYQQLPDLHGIAIAALLIKMACAFGGFVIAAAYLRSHADWAPSRRRRTWTVLLLLAAIAITSAAFLRWFS